MIRSQTIICRPSREKDSGVEVIRWFQDSKVQEA